MTITADRIYDQEYYFSKFINRVVKLKPQLVFDRVYINHGIDVMHKAARSLLNCADHLQIVHDEFPLQNTGNDNLYSIQFSQ